MKKKVKLLPLCKVMCGSCPFRTGSKYEFLRPDLTASAATEASRICHSTGVSAFYGRTGKKPKLCRGARDFQLNLFYRLGFIEAPTDEAWAKKVKEMGIA